VNGKPQPVKRKSSIKMFWHTFASLNEMELYKNECKKDVKSSWILQDFVIRKIQKRCFKKN
jgi:hypothetical protein